MEKKNCTICSIPLMPVSNEYLCVHCHHEKMVDQELIEKQKTKLRSWYDTDVSWEKRLQDSLERGYSNFYNVNFLPSSSVNRTYYLPNGEWLPTYSDTLLKTKLSWSQLEELKTGRYLIYRLKVCLIPVRYSISDMHQRLYKYSFLVHYPKQSICFQYNLCYEKQKDNPFQVFPYNEYQYRLFNIRTVSSMDEMKHRKLEILNPFGLVHYPDWMMDFLNAHKLSLFHNFRYIHFMDLFLWEQYWKFIHRTLLLFETSAFQKINCMDIKRYIMQFLMTK